MQILTFDHPLVVGHRGFRARYPENTRVSFEAATNAGVEMVELDVHLSRDDQLVVIHDDRVDRTTSGTGDVSAMTLAELKKLDAGSWFNERFAGERIPTLKEVFDCVGDRVKINIEIKFAGTDYVPGRIETAVLDLIRREDAASRVLISSFDPRVVQYIRRADPSLAAAFISRSADGMKTVDFCRQLGVYSFHPNFRCLNTELITGLHDAGIHVFPYTVNTEPDFQKMMQLGVDGVITDDPVVFKKWYANNPAQPAGN
ncbi:MAG: glycerophosphodiester phosphodiesterase [Deltaproteobacteria bacterium]|nr:MAG: glycerophosphodiester phosphodiesterase [Deltaproteobacteria bacterium]